MAWVVALSVAPQVLADPPGSGIVQPKLTVVVSATGGLQRKEGEARDVGGLTLLRLCGPGEEKGEEGGERSHCVLPQLMTTPIWEVLVKFTSVKTF